MLFHYVTLTLHRAGLPWTGKWRLGYQFVEFLLKNVYNFQNQNLLVLDTPVIRHIRWKMIELSTDSDIYVYTYSKVDLFYLFKIFPNNIFFSLV